MTNTVKIQHTAPAVINTTEVTLPFFYICGTYNKNYCCITESFTLITVRYNDIYINMDTIQYEDSEEVAGRLEKDMREKLYTPIDEAVFHHHFSAAHRELFYKLNHNLRPIQ
jgi:hypothetical protein